MPDDIQEQAHTAPRVVWHASRSNIARPTIEGRTAADNHANSGLGIFCATVPRDYVCMFGACVHEITLIKNPRCLRLASKDLALMGQDEPRQWFDEHGRQLARDFDVIDLVEIDGRIEQAIILADAAIAGSRALSLEQYQSIMIHGPVSRRRLGR